MTDPGASDDGQELAEVRGEIDGLRAELVRLDTDPAYRESLLAAYRADQIYELGRLSWRRYLLTAGQPDTDPAAIDDALREVVATLQQARAEHPAGTEAGTDIAWWLGLAWVDRYLADTDPAALDRAIELTAEVVAADLGPAERAYARSQLAESLLERYGLAGDPADLDRAVVEAEWAAEQDPPTTPDDETDPGGEHDPDDESGAADEAGWRPAALLAAGRARTQRWHRTRQREDLAAAIGHFDRLANADRSADQPYGSGADLPAPVLGELAQLLHDRAALLLGEEIRTVATSDGSAGATAQRPTTGDGPAVDREAAGVALAAGRHWARTALARCAADDPLRPRLLAVQAFLGWSHYRLTRQAEELDGVEQELLAALRAYEAAGSADEERQLLTSMQGLLVTERKIRGLPDRPEDDALLGELLTGVKQAMQEYTAGNPFQHPGTGLPPWATGLLPQRESVAKLDQAIAHWHTLPAEAPDRARQAGLLAISAIMAHQYGYRELDHLQIIEMLKVARTTALDDPAWQQQTLALQGAVGALAAQVGHADQIDPALAALTEARQLAPDDDPATAEIDMNIASAKQLRAQLHDDLGGSAEAMADQADLAGRSNLTEQQRLLLRLQQAALRAERAQQRQDRAELDAAASELRAGLALLPAGDIRHGHFSTVLAAVEMAQSMLADDQLDGAALQRVAEQIKAGTATPGLASAQAADRGVYALLLEAGAALQNRDAATLERLLGTASERIDRMPRASSSTLHMRVLLAGLYMARMEAWRSFDDIDRAIEQLEICRPYVDPTHQLWSTEIFMLSHAYRLRDDPAHDDRRQSRELGLQALRGYAWRTLVQSGPAEAALAGRDVNTSATEVLAWCVQDDQPAQAVRALDASRGLVLQAASRSRDVPARLAAAGQPALAEQWRTLADGDQVIPAPLRQQVMRVLLEHERSLDAGARIDLLDPPEPADITAALRSAGADALVYLVPDSDDRPPVAVVVPAGGEPRILPLPILAARFTVLDDYLATRLAGRHRTAGVREAELLDGTPYPQTDDPAAHQALRRLADWAWYAGMEQLLHYCVEQGFSRPYRLVLVPMGAFGLVPWHAARAPGGRYVIEDAVLSYAASAQMFVGTMQRAAVPPDAESLVVGDPTGDLAHAGTEAVAIRDTLYPTAPYLGRRPDGRATGRGSPGELLEWLRSSLGADRGTLHLACHGVVVPEGPESSYLVLAGRGGPTPLTAARIADEARRSAQGFRLGTVVLAACSSGVPGRAYDEAYSLATVFLMAGARSVIGSLWPVPDEATSLLMYLLHHYLVVERLGAAQALRQAQLWMLDPDPVPPAGMPAALRERMATIDPEDLGGWAGFSHLGQW